MDPDHPEQVQGEKEEVAVSCPGPSQPPGDSPAVAIQKEGQENGEKQKHCKGRHCHQEGIHRGWGKSLKGHHGCHGRVGHHGHHGRYGHHGHHGRHGHHGHHGRHGCHKQHGSVGHDHHGSMGHHGHTHQHGCRVDHVHC